MSQENFTYIVKCSDGSCTQDGQMIWSKGLKAHNSGRGAKYTKTRRPVELVYYEKFSDKTGGYEPGGQDQTAVTQPEA